MSKSKHLRPRRNPPDWCPACRKHRYPGKRQALLAIAAMHADGRAAKHPRADEPLEAYPCRYRHGAWHVGHAGKAKPWLMDERRA